MQFYCGGVLMNDLVAPRYVGPFIPTISISNPPGGLTMTVQSYSYGIPQPYQTTITPTSCYGSLSGNGPSSGNGINHVASTCLNLVYRGALEATTFR